MKLQSYLSLVDMVGLAVCLNTNIAQFHQLMQVCFILLWWESVLVVIVKHETLNLFKLGGHGIMMAACLNTNIAQFQQSIQVYNIVMKISISCDFLSSQQE